MSSADRPAAWSAADTVVVALLALLALALRVAWWHAFVHVIEIEGTNYARLGENLAAGRGFLGMDELGPQLIYPPLYPALIAGGMGLGFAAESAARMVSLCAGTITPVLFLLIARRLYGRRAGLWAGLTAAVHPLLVAMSVAVLAESLYLALVLAAVYLVQRVFERPALVCAAGSGALLGCAYLCRPEAMFLTIVLAAGVLLARWSRPRSGAASALVVLAGFGAFAAPYVHYLHATTGQWRMEAKSPQGLLYQAGVAEGRRPGEIYWGIDAQLNGTGLSNMPDVEQVHRAHESRANRLKLFVWQARENLPQLWRGIAHPQFGGLVFGLLLGIGLLRAPWNLSRALGEYPAAAIAALVAGPFLIWPFVLDRSLFMLMAAGVPWAGRGLSIVQETVNRRVHGTVQARLAAFAPGGVASLAMLALVAANSASGVRHTDELSQSSSSLAQYAGVGRWLGEQSTRARVADTGPTVAYYAGAVLVRFPWTDGPTALNYLQRADVQYVVIRENALNSRPYLRDWFDSPPTDHLRLVREFTDRENGATRIYRWSP